jgi:hypothetical protein
MGCSEERGYMEKKVDNNKIYHENEGKIDEQ